MHDRERQQAAVRRARRHSSIVRALRWITPSLAVLSLGLYVTSSTLTYTAGNLSATITGVQLSRERLTMLNPQLRGETKDGGRYLIRADNASQFISTPDEVALEAVRAEILDAQGSQTTMTAKKGMFRTKKQLLDLDGGIDVAGSQGLKANLSKAQVDMKTQRIRSDAPVYAETRDGWIRGKGLTIFAEEKRAVFDGPVRVMLNVRDRDAKRGDAGTAQAGAEQGGANGIRRNATPEPGTPGDASQQGADGGWAARVSSAGGSQSGRVGVQTQ